MVFQPQSPDPSCLAAAPSFPWPFFSLKLFLALCKAMFIAFPHDDSLFSDPCLMQSLDHTS
jgi:hypothetical protein